MDSSSLFLSSLSWLWLNTIESPLLEDLDDIEAPFLRQRFRWTEPVKDGCGRISGERTHDKQTYTHPRSKVKIEITE